MLQQRHEPSSNDILVFPEPGNLGREIPVGDVALRVLEAPGSNNQKITFAYPGAFLDFSFDPTHPRGSIHTQNTDMIRPHHLFGKAELFALSLFG